MCIVFSAQGARSFVSINSASKEAWEFISLEKWREVLGLEFPLIPLQRKRGRMP